MIPLREVPSTEVPDKPVVGSIMLAQGKDGPTWRLALGQDEAWLVPPDGEMAYHLTHEAFAEHVTQLATQTVLLVTVRNVPGRGAISFNGRTESQQTLTTWLAQRGDVHAAGSLKKRLAYSLPIGIMIAGLAASNLVSDKAAFNPFSFAGGLAMIIIALVARKSPRPILFLADGGVWLLLAASNVFRSTGTGSILFAVMCLFFAVLSLNSYRFYRSLSPR